MNEKSPFRPQDLAELEALLERADAVVAMKDAAVPAFADNALVIGMRHDVDNFIEPAVRMAQWEAERGYESTYFILHTAPYWEQKDTLAAALEVISECGHEIGFHVNAITKALETQGDPVIIARDAVNELRDYGYDVTGVVAHGDEACYRFGFINDELFTESRRPEYGPARRMVHTVELRPVSRKSLGFEYDPNWLPRGQYLSDSGGEWSTRFEDVAEAWPSNGQLHMLVHPDWWAEAFAPLEVPA